MKEACCESTDLVGAWHTRACAGDHHEPLNGSGTNEPSLTRSREVGGTGLSSKGARNPVDGSSSFPKKGDIYDNLATDGYAPADDRPIFRASQ